MSTLFWTDIVGPLTQGAVSGILVGIAILGIGLKFSKSIDGIAYNIETMSDSVSKVEEEVRSVDLKELEKSVLRLEWELGSGKDPGNSVVYNLPESEIEVTISLLAGHPEGIPTIYEERENAAHPTMDDLEEFGKDKDDPDNNKQEDIVQKVPSSLNSDDITAVNLEFGERIRSQAVQSKLNEDNDLEETEKNMFDGYEPTFKALSPFEMVFAVPTDDYNLVAEWLPYMLDKIDRYHLEFEQESTLFDDIVETELYSE